MGPRKMPGMRPLFWQLTPPQPTAWNYQSPIPECAVPPSLHPSWASPQIWCQPFAPHIPGVRSRVLGQSPLQGSAGAPDIHQLDTEESLASLKGPSMAAGMARLTRQDITRRGPSASAQPPLPSPTTASHSPASPALCADSSSGWGGSPQGPRRLPFPPLYRSPGCQWWRWPPARPAAHGAGSDPSQHTGPLG